MKFPVLCPDGDCGERVDREDVELCGFTHQQMDKWDQIALRSAVESDREWKYVITELCFSSLLTSTRIHYRCCLTPDCQNGVLWQEDLHPEFRWVLMLEEGLYLRACTCR